MEPEFSIDPVDIAFPDEWTLPIVFSSPHSGAYYPESFVDQSPLDLITLRQSEDFMVDTLFSAAPQMGAPLIKSNFPRAYCDANRQPYELDPAMFKDPLPPHVTTCNARISAGIGTIPKVVSAGKNIYSRRLAFEEAENRLERCYFPYHAALKNLVEQGIHRFGKILLVDCHSMPSNVHLGHVIPPLSDFILGDRFGNSCPSEVSALIARSLKSSGYTVSYNSPYAGGYITQHYSAASPDISVLQIEVNRNLYMNQATLEATENMTVMKSHLADVIKKIGNLLTLKKAS